MKILSHRGFWLEHHEKNRLPALARSFAAGFGVEIDVRDNHGYLVISHDPPSGHPLPLVELLELHRAIGPDLPLAINVKSCGLASMLAETLTPFAPKDVFFFDLAVPDYHSYFALSLPALARLSEYETIPVFKGQTAGLWIDCFESDWIGSSDVSRALTTHPRVCLVSPELHGRPYLGVWERYRSMPCADASRLYLCTDYPQEAAEFFEREASV